MNKSMTVQRSAWRDWWEGTRRADIWLTLAWFDIVFRYRRSMLGPWWLTISMAVMIIGMGPLYGSLFKVDLARFFPHLALGIILWTFFSGLISDACNTFIASSNYLKHSYFPISMFVWRTVARNLIQLAHHIVIYIPIALWSRPTLDAAVFNAVAAIALVIVNAHGLGITLGLLCSRFRDLTQIVTSSMQLLMFLTPVFWLPESLPDRAQFILFNPFAQFMDLIRSPLMGIEIGASSWLGALCWTALNLTIAAFTFSRLRRRVVYWL